MALTDDHGHNEVDPYGCVNAYSKYYYSIINDSWWDLLKVEGNWTILESSASIKNKGYRYGVQGTGPNMLPVSHKSGDKSVSDSSYSFNETVPSSWEAVLIDSSAIYSFGVVTFCDITRTSSTWHFEAPNTVHNP